MWFYKRFRRSSGCGLGQCSFGVECPRNRYRVLDSVPRARERREGKERNEEEREGKGRATRTRRLHLT